MDRWVGATPYWLAAKFLELDMMRVLADAGADTRLPSRDGTTPLMAAAGLGYRRGGGSAFITDRRDFSAYNPVASAAEGSRIPEAEERRALAAVELALDLGGDVTATSESGNTALHAAASHGMDAIVEFLVSSGADPRAENNRGQTPLEMAVYREGIAGAALVRESTAGLLRELDPTRHPAEPHQHPEAQAFANPTPTSARSVAAGAAVYEQRCATCHGTAAMGDGPLAAGTAAYGARPSNLADATWQHGSSDGEIFAAIRDGIGPGFAMDAFRGALTDDEIWDVVNYLKSLSGL
jgi:mono/diheme cytochrome c family protein